jgi:hypothetical protein
MAVATVHLFPAIGAFAQPSKPQEQVKPLVLTSLCADDPEVYRRWRVRNNNQFPVMATYEVYGTSQQGTLTVPPGDSFFYTQPVNGPNTTLIRWWDGTRWAQQVKASSGETCPRALLLEGSREVPADAQPGHRIVRFRTGKISAPNKFVYTLIPGTGDTHNHFFQVMGDSLAVSPEFRATPGMQLSFRARSLDRNNGKIAEGTFIIKVTTAQQAQVWALEITGNAIAEREPAGTMVGQLSVLQNGSSVPASFSINQEQEGIFTLEGNLLKTAVMLYFRQQASYQVSITAYLGSGQTLTRELTIQVTQKPSPPTSLQVQWPQAIGSQASVGTVAGFLKVVDPDPFDQHTFELLPASGQNGHLFFALQGDTLVTTRTFQYYVQNRFTFRVKVTDLDGASLTRTFTVEIALENQSPVALQLSLNKVKELQPGGTLVGLLSATDPDSLDQHQYTLADGPGSVHNHLFVLQGNELRTADKFHFHDQPQLNIRVKTSDLTGASFERTFSILVANIPDHPTAISLSENHFPEQLPYGTTIATLQTTDPNPFDQHQYALVAGEGSDDNDLFFIEGDQLHTAKVFLYPEKSPLRIRVRTTDLDGATLEAPFTLSVTNALNPPLAVEFLPEQPIFRTTPRLSVLGFVRAIDLDPFDVHHYELVPGEGDQDNHAFTLAGDTLRNVVDFTLTEQVVFFARIRATDPDGLFVEQILEFNVEDIIRVGAGYFIGTPVEAAAGNSTSTMLADIDQDGDLDAIVGYANQASRVYLNDGTGNFTQKAQPFSPTSSSYNLAMADFNGDGHIDLVLPSWERNPTLWLNDGQGNFSLAFTFRNMTQNMAVAALDVNQDGHPDVVVSEFSRRTHVWLNDGQGEFTLGGNFAGERLNNLRVADFNNDGYPDLFASRQGPGSGIWLNDQQGNFTWSAQNLPIDFTVVDMNAGDLDGNGFIDLVIGNISGFNLIWMGQPDGSFVVSQEKTSDHITFGVTLGDIDHDGDLDIILANRWAPTEVWFNNGQGRFTNSFQNLGTNDVRRIALGRLNQDFSTDAFIVGFQGQDHVWLNSAPPSTIFLSANQVRENLPSGTFIGKLATLDYDPWDFAHTFSLAASAPGLSQSFFSIRHDSLFTARPLDFEAQSRHVVRIRATDRAGSFAEREFAIHVTDHNDAPTMDTPAPVLLNAARQVAIPLTGISTGDLVPQQLAIQPWVSHPELFEETTLEYIPVRPTGNLYLTPLPGKQGVAEIRLFLKDDGGTENGGTDSLWVSFQVTVQTPHSDEGPVVAYTYFPNPVSNLLTIALETGTPEQTTIEIADMAGFVVFRVQPGAMETTIPVSHLSTGIYLIRVIQGQAASVSRFIKG